MSKAVLVLGQQRCLAGRAQRGEMEGEKGQQLEGEQKHERGIKSCLFAVRNDPVEKRRLMVQGEEKNGEVLEAGALTPVQSARARGGAASESPHQKKGRASGQPGARIHGKAEDRDGGSGHLQLLWFTYREDGDWSSEESRLTGEIQFN